MNAAYGYAEHLHFRSHRAGPVPLETVDRFASAGVLEAGLGHLGLFPGGNHRVVASTAPALPEGALPAFRYSASR